mmetsp:Transcript_1342/g.1611  ORF Transcript_1342/g.1611 Transcript_1342/m.1611 type:complete len:445 (-) Transcript_1342:84-1418(-)|eukprot:CAMPEP_0184021468 /NCGR_PEP_ID=MMETSP0954-20121128/9948_1 /TAXON_ID=627963 /ORGANISM="Aplanochytrium sp, Strain PBS07" /LENGTH=444 /DNA_ID=CAMNT_0026303497 /DNA_START=223 /DNA_END=1557 /DNA_ORIENTATION=+
MAADEENELLEMFEDNNVDDEIEEDIKEKAAVNPSEVMGLARALKNETGMLRAFTTRLQDEHEKKKKLIKENREKVKLNKQLPFLVGNVVELLDLENEEENEDGSAKDVEDSRMTKSVVIKTSTRQTIFLPVIGLVPAEELMPGDLVGTNKDSYLILEKLPSEYDSRVKAMEVEMNEGDNKLKDNFGMIGGLEKQLGELKEAIIEPLRNKHLFDSIGIKPPKGVLLHGPPGTGKTLMARACAAATDCIFLKLAGPSLVQMFIGDGAKLVRDAFALAREKSVGRGGAIIFIDEIDAVGGKRFDSDASGDREVQRTMLELLNQLDGFSDDDNIKVIAATNRPDVLDPALMRSGRLDRKIELPHPPENARAKILEIHSRPLTTADDINFAELARSTDDFNGAQLKAVCIEAGMLAVRNNADTVSHEDFVQGIAEVLGKKKASLEYYA